MQNHYMIYIEGTGVDKEKDEILEVGLVELEYKFPYWYPTGKEFHKILHYSGEPESVFAKEHMQELYTKCNEAPITADYRRTKTEIHNFLHADVPNNDPRFFMGWNASNYDLPFMFAKGLLTPSFYEEVNGEEFLRGDVHYCNYELIGALNYVLNVTGLDKKAVMAMAQSLNPTELVLREGKAHGAIFDCYNQLMLINGLIEIGRLGIKR